MTHRFWHISARAVFLAMEGLGLLILLLFVGSGFMLWRMGQGAVDLAFAKPYIQQALSDADDRHDVIMDRVFLERPNNRGPVVLGIDGLKIVRRDTQATVLTIDEADISFSYIHLLVGRIRPVAVILQSPAVLLVRREDGLDFILQGKKESTSVAAGTAQDLPRQIETFVSWLDDPSVRRGFLRTLKTVEIKNAGVLLRDMTRHVSWYLTDFDLTLRDQKDSVKAYMSISMSEAEKSKADLMAYLTYRRDHGDFAFSASVDQFNPIALTKFLPEEIDVGETDLVINGQIGAVLDKGFALQSASINLDVPAGLIDIPREFDEPLTLKDAHMETSYVRADKMFDLKNFRAVISDIPVEGTGRALLSPEGISAPVVFKTIGDVASSAVKPIFPNSEKDGEAAKWLLELMTGGVYRDVVFSSEILMRREKKEEQPDHWVFDSKNTKLDFAFEGIDVLYHDTLMPAKECKGTGTLDVTGDKLTIDGEAKIGDLVGRNAKLEFTDIMVRGGGYAKISFDAAGSLQTAFQYIADEPIGMNDFGFDSKNAKGKIDVSAYLEFPTLKDAPREAFKVTAKATLSDVTLPKVVEGLTLTGGPLALDVKEGSFTVGGKGKLDGRDIALTWHEYFDPARQPYAAQVKAQIVADAELRHKFGVHLDDYFTGAIPVDATYTDYADDRSALDMTGDLTPLLIHIKPFKYEKPVGQAGTVSLKADMNKGVLKTVEGLRLSAPNLSLKDARLTFAPMNGKTAELSGGVLPLATIGRTQAKADFEVTPKNLLKVSASGPVFDAYPFMQGDETRADKTEKPENPLTMMVSLSADRMLTGEDLSLGKTKIYLETDTDGDMTRLEMDSIAGVGDIYLRFKPDAAGKRSFRLEAADAGATLKAFDLYDQVRGGKIIIAGEPRAGTLRGDIVGTAQIENFTIVKAPALAKLLSIMSLTGLGELLNNQGLAFSKLESDFEWLFRPEGNLLLVKNGRTSGSSIGLTFEGQFDRGANTTDLRGTIIPMTELNSFLKNIPIIGDILTGGTGLIAATYTMKGPSKEPAVAINPLSVLTPGFLRTILFEGGFKTPPSAAEKPQGQR
jgi:hypothetical protein